MSIKKITHVAVVGAGVMGRQIALNAAWNGFSVVLTDTVPEVLTQAREWAEQYTAVSMEKKKITEDDARTIWGRLSFTPELSQAMAQCQLVIEAIVEKEEIKRQLFSAIDRMAPASTILATNSSYIPSSAFQNDVSHPGRLINLHYFNPAMRMELVEIVAGEHTDPQVTDIIRDFAQGIGKRAILVRKEVEGFVVNRLLKALQDEAYNLLESGVASFEDIDTGAELGLRHPMGPFRLMDMTGLDLNYFNRQRIYEASGRPEDMPPRSLVEHIEAKRFGKKTGKGWYDYPAQPSGVEK